MKILFVGSSASPVYVNAFYEEARRVDDIEPSLFLCDIRDQNIQIISRAEAKFACGPSVDKINYHLFRQCEEEKFDMIFLYNCRLIYAKTIERIKQLGLFVATYNNDNPFSNFFPTYYWRHYVKSIQYADINYVYRDSNLLDCNKAGSRCTKILRSYYIKERNFYIPDSEIDIDVPQVVFLGHYEKDERVTYIRALLDAGIEIGIPKSTGRRYGLCSNNLIEIDNTYDSYNLLLNKAKIALVFLSTINRDLYTRRCFEIPAVKTLMIAPYTEDLANMFQEDKEIVFFRDVGDLVRKVQYYLKHDDERQLICENAYNRLVRDGHEARDRVIEVMKDYYELCR